MPELTSKHLTEAIDQELTNRVEELGFTPGLVILSDNIEHSPSLLYVGIKQRIAAKVGISATSVFTNNSDALRDSVADHNSREEVDGLIVQLPLMDVDSTGGVVGQISPAKDVDGLGEQAYHSPATPLGILNLIEGYGIDYLNAPTAILGKGRLVGAPLEELMLRRGARQVHSFDLESTKEEVKEGLNAARLIISATGQPGLVTPAGFDTIDNSKVFIDAGAAESGGIVVGDISEELRKLAIEKGSFITPKKGGVGPMTVRALLSNVVSSAEQR